MDLLEGVNDIHGDRVPDLVARHRGTGVIYLYPGSLLSRVTLSHPTGGTWSGLNALA